MIYDEVADFAEKRAFVRDLLEYLAPVAEDLGAWRALEVGGGGGVLAGLLAGTFQHVLSTDLVNPYIKMAGRPYEALVEKFERAGEVFPREKVEFLAADAQRLHFRDRWFDICFSQNAFEHIPDPEMALREAVRVTRPGGFVYAQFDPVWTADSGSHFIDRIGEPWLHLLEDDEALVRRMQQCDALPDEIEAFQSEMNRMPITYYREMFPRIIRQLDLEIVIHHEWAGTIDLNWVNHPNLAKASAKWSIPVEDLLVRGMRYLLRTSLN